MKQEKSSETEMEATLVKLHPHTGRTHQLRVHLSSIGHPIIGDYNYEVPFTDHERMMLHAWKINLPLSTDASHQSQKNKEFLEKRNNFKKMKIAYRKSQQENNGREGTPVQDLRKQSNDELEDIQLETENPFENLLSDK